MADEAASIVDKVKQYFYEDDSFEETFQTWAKEHSDIISRDEEEMKLECVLRRLAAAVRGPTHARCGAPWGERRAMRLRLPSAGVGCAPLGGAGARASQGGHAAVVLQQPTETRAHAAPRCLLLA